MSDQPQSRQKSTSDENFPVASIFLPRSQRVIIMAYYRFVRFCDDIADAPSLSGPEKVAQLSALGEDLISQTGHPLALDLAGCFKDANLDCALACDLLKAFIQDANQASYQKLEDLIDYCRYSANPVGRFLLALNKIDTPEAQPASDALCTVLQILNHLQDCGDDWRDLKRCYIPLEIMKYHGALLTDLEKTNSSPSLKAVIDQLLDHSKILIEHACRLPNYVPRGRFRIQVWATIACAEALYDKLRVDDPLAKRVELSTHDKLLCGLRGLYRGIF